MAKKFELTPSFGVPVPVLPNATTPVPVDEYVSDEFFARERDAVFAKSWLLVGRAAELTKAGDFLVFNLAVCNTSVLVVRGKNGELCAFHNCCVHRGSKLKHADYGNCTALTCSYHGWVYALDGHLLNAPHQELFGDVDWASVGLSPVTLDVWGGFVFVNLALEPATSLQEYLQPLPEALQCYLEDTQWQWYDGFRAEFDANWKLLVDVQIESYHAVSLHQRTFGTLGPDCTRVSLYPDSVAVPGRTSEYLPEDPSVLPPNAISGLAMQYGDASMYNLNDASNVASTFPGAINESRDPRWIFDNYPIFPNVVLIIEHEQILLQRAWPISPHRTLWEMDWFFRGKAKTFGETFSREQGFIQARDTITEDMTTVEGLHMNYRSGRYGGMLLNDMEVLVRGFRDRIRRAVTAEP